MERVEYKVLRHNDDLGGWREGAEQIGNELDATLLNRYGNEGWSICGTFASNEGDGATLVLSRPKAAWTGH